jgi:hypothetical protein
MAGEITENNMAEFNPEAQMQDITRQREMAKLLLQKGMADNLQGQMVSGRYVGASPWQGIANMYATYSGRQLAEESDKKQAQLAEMLRAEGDKDLLAYNEAITPRAAVEAKPEIIPQGQTAFDDQGLPTYGYKMATEAVPEKKADYALGMSILRKSKDPETRAMAKALMSEQLKTLILPEGSTAVRGSLTGVGGQTIQGAPKVSQSLKDAAKEAKLDINNIDNWSPQDWSRARTFEANAAALTRPKVEVNIPNFAEKTFAGGLAEDQVKKFSTLQTNAEKAPDVLRSVAESKKILNSGKFFSGSPANLQLEMAKYADAVGLGGKDTKTKAANTQTLITNAAGTTLDSIAGAGLGSGQGFTDKDLRFLQEAKSFRIDMTDENIRRVLDLQERAAKASVGRYNERLRSLPQSSIQSLGLKEVVLPRTADEIVEGK